MIANRKLIAAVAAVPVALAVGCSKQPQGTTAAEAEAAGRPVPPTMFAAIPADTPYVFAAVDPLPPEIWEMSIGMYAGLGDVVRAGGEAMLADESTPGELKLLVALLEEISAQPDAEGYASLGFSTEPRVAFYGLGIAPVARLELGDPAALRETVARIEARSGYTVPTRDVAGYPVWWLGGDGDLVVGMAILGDELVAAFGAREAAVSQAFEVLVGARDVGPTLAESEVRAFAKTHGLLESGVGYVDTRRLATLLLGAGEGLGAEMTAAVVGGGPQVSQACVDAAVGALAHAPRITFGYTEVSAERFSMEGTLELSSELAELVAAAQTRMPGLTSDFDEPALFAMGGAIDLRKGSRVLGRIAGELKAVGKACEQPDLQGAATELASAASTKIPPPFSSIKGALLVLQSVDVAGMKAEGYALAGINNPAMLLRLAKPFVPQLAELNIRGDGSFRPLPESLTSMVPFELGLRYAIGDSGVAIAAGDAGRGAAKAAMKNRPEVSPLFMVSYDYQAAFELLSDAMPGKAGLSADEQALQEMVVAMTSYMGPFVGVVTPAERGLRFSSTLEIHASGK